MIGRALLLATAAVVASGCATHTRFDRAVAAAPPAGACEVEFFRKKAAGPTRPFELVTRAESHVQRNVFFGGTATLEDDAFEELRVQACRVGADAVIVDDYIESRAAEFSHVHVWASLVRYTAPPP